MPRTYCDETKLTGNSHDRTEVIGIIIIARDCTVDVALALGNEEGRREREYVANTRRSPSR